MYVKARSDRERQQWLIALGSAKAGIDMVRKERQWRGGERKSEKVVATRTTAKVATTTTTEKLATAAAAAKVTTTEKVAAAAATAARAKVATITAAKLAVSKTILI